MKTILILAIATVGTIGAAALFAANDTQPAGTAAPAPAAAKADGMKCHSPEKAAKVHGCCMAGGHAEAQPADAGASCHKK